MVLSSFPRDAFALRMWLMKPYSCLPSFPSILTCHTPNLSLAMLQLTLSEESSRGREGSPTPTPAADSPQPSTSSRVDGQPALKKVKKGSGTGYGMAEVTEVLKEHFTAVRKEQDEMAEQVLVQCN